MTLSRTSKHLFNISRNCVHHLHGELVSSPDHPFRDEIFPNIHPESFVVQIEAILSSPIATYMGENADLHLATASLQVAEESNKVLPKPPLPQIKQS